MGDFCDLIAWLCFLTVDYGIALLVFWVCMVWQFGVFWIQILMFGLVCDRICGFAVFGDFACLGGVCGFSGFGSLVMFCLLGMEFVGLDIFEVLVFCVC